jgi:hypothetical protein
VTRTRSATASARRRFSVAAGSVLVLAAGALAATANPAGAETKTKDWKTAAARLDDLLVARFKTQKDLVVAPRSDDAEFLRRVTMDLTGTIPTEADAVAFLQDPSPEKRAALVDRLLADPKHADWFGTWYSNLLVGTALRDRNLNRRTFNDWIRDQFASNRPYDQMVYDLVTASGNSDVNGAIGFVSSFERSAADAAGKTSRYFLGVQIQCAQCHDHPYDKRIKQADFQAFAAFFFTTTHTRNQSPGNPEISFDVQTYDKTDMMGGGRRTGPMMGGRRGQPLMLEPPAKGTRPNFNPAEIPDAKLLLGRTVKDVPGVNRREILAKWMTSKSNEWFSEAFANRMWAYLLGHGIVHPVDDFSNTNKPTNPELLKALADEFAHSDFDVNHLIRVIVGTEAYQRTSKMPRDLERPDPSLYAVGAVRPLTVEQSFNAFYRATGGEQDLQRMMRGGAMGDMGKAKGQLIDPRMRIYQLFRRSFDDDEAAESEEFTGTIPRGLLMMNGQMINGLVSARPGSPLAKILQGERSDRERIRRVYLTTLSREPSPSELSKAIDHVHTSRAEREGYEDLFWALCNTTEFMSNH